MPEFFAYTDMSFLLLLRDKGYVEKTEEGYVTTGKTDLIIRGALEKELSAHKTEHP